MISYSVYKVVHLLGVMMVFLALGGATTKSIHSDAKNTSWRKTIAITHGLGLVLSLVGGFGLLARLGVVHGSLPGWIMLKLGIWVLFAGLLTITYRRPAWAKFIWPLTLLLGTVAAYLAGSKPFS